MPLQKFLTVKGLPTSEDELRETLKSSLVREVRHYVLGPGMISNIPQAARRWAQRMGVIQKSRFIEGKIPDSYTDAARTVTEAGVVPLFWTCAVFGREKDLFFGKTDTLMFYAQEVMPLDHMQLAMRPEVWKDSYAKEIVDNCRFPIECGVVTSHASPKPLLDTLFRNSDDYCIWVEADSNGDAAKRVRECTADICITTETARKYYGLHCVFDFGTPDMVFFGGLTKHGANVLSAAYAATLEMAAS